MGRGQDRQQRKNRSGLTAAQKKARKNKLAATATKQSAARLQANNAAIGRFLGRFSGNPTTVTNNKADQDGDAIMDETNPTETAAGSEANDTAGEGGVNLTAEQNEGGDVEDNDVVVTFSENICHAIEHTPIVANLDLEGDLDGMLDDDEGSVDGDDGPSNQKQAPAPNGAQQKYVCFLQRRIQYELSKDFPALEDRWLQKYLEESDWVVLKNKAPSIAQQLGLHTPTEGQKYYPNYYTDVHFWLPDVRWGAECMPACPNCRTNKHVGVHGFRDNHFGRQIVDQSPEDTVAVHARSRGNNGSPK